MLKLNLAYLFKVRGVKSAFGFLRKIGFTHYVAYSWSSERRKNLHIEHLTKLCIAPRMICCAGRMASIHLQQATHSKSLEVNMISHSILT